MHPCLTPFSMSTSLRVPNLGVTPMLFAPSTDIEWSFGSSCTWLYNLKIWWSFSGTLCQILFDSLDQFHISTKTLIICYFHTPLECLWNTCIFIIMIYCSCGGVHVKCYSLFCTLCTSTSNKAYYSSHNTQKANSQTTNLTTSDLMPRKDTLAQS